ncbi:hypothetical protein WJX75_009181 [Coccomyxa subellipsoidea]|uniref:Uncharacterized protein n=1 Tax=Coccomyxa subellipsoidea TaxID=248742 RepID=A0ABR2YB22_9CHLO
MVDIGEVLPAFQVQSKTQTQRFKDQTFEQLEKLVQIKVLEDFLDAAIKGKKGKLPYNSLPDTASVLEVAPCFPADVVYKRPREMEPADSAEAILAAMRRFTGAVGSDEVQQDAAGDAVPTGEASGGSHLSAGSVPGNMSADLGGDAVAQVSGALGGAARGRTGPSGDLDAAACSMDERHTVRQLRRRLVGSARPADDCAALGGMPVPSCSTSDGGTPREGARSAGVARTKLHPRVDLLGLPPCLSSACIGLLRRMTTPQVMRLGWATCLDGP